MISQLDQNSRTAAERSSPYARDAAAGVPHARSRWPPRSDGPDLGPPCRGAPDRASCPPAGRPSSCRSGRDEICAPVVSNVSSAAAADGDGTVPILPARHHHPGRRHRRRRRRLHSSLPSRGGGGGGGRGTRYRHTGARPAAGSAPAACSGTPSGTT